MSVKSVQYPAATRSGTSRRVSWIALGTAALSLLAAQAHASDQPESRTVNFSDLDLNKSEDVHRLYGRLRFAADNVCGELDSRDLQLKRQHQQCYRQVLSAAVAEVNHSALTALHAENRSIRLARSPAERRS